MIKLAILDMDGVILDSMGIWEDLRRKYLKTQGVNAPESLDELLYYMSLEESSDYLQKNYLQGKTVKEIQLGIEQTLLSYYKEDVSPKEGAKELLEYFSSKGIPIAAATSSPRCHVEAALKRLRLLKYFDCIYTTTELNTNKKSPDIYNLIAQKIGVLPRDCAVFEDCKFAIETAACAGFKTVGIYDKYSEKRGYGVRNLSNYYLESLLDYKRILR